MATGGLTRAALMLGQILATHSRVLNRLGGDRAGGLAAAGCWPLEKADPMSPLAPEIARTGTTIRGRCIVAMQDITEIDFAGRDRRRRILGPAGDGVSKGFFIQDRVRLCSRGWAKAGMTPGMVRCE